MSIDTSDELDGTEVLVPAADVVEMPVADEVIVWHPDRAVPLQLNSVATTIWWHFETAPLDEVAHDVAQFYRQPIDRVKPGVHYVTRSLRAAGLLRTAGDRAERVPESDTKPATAPVEHESSAEIGPAAGWLQRRATHRQSARVGRMRFGVASNTAELDGHVSALLSSHLDGAGDAPVRYFLVDAGDSGAGYRYWLLSDTGLPLERTTAPDELVQRLGLHVAELAHVQDTAGVPLRLGVLEASDHAVAIQWDLLSARPALEPSLDRLGYRIRSGQWAVIDPSDFSVQPAATLADSGDGQAVGPALALGAIVGWFGPGSLDVPNTHAEWGWSLAMYGVASTDPGPIDRHRLLETAVALAAASRVESLTDAGPSALLRLLDDITRSWT